MNIGEDLVLIKDPAEAARRMLSGEFLADGEGRQHLWDGFTFRRYEKSGRSNAVIRFDGLYYSPCGWDNPCEWDGPRGLHEEG
jgi:hypothetical protein